MFKKFIDYITKFIFLPRCVNCREVNENYDSLCKNCWKNIEFITEPYCITCGCPFQDLNYNENTECYNCSIIQEKDKKIIYRSLMYYNQESAQIIFKLKYQDRLELGKFIGKMIENHYKKILEEVDIVCPVPIHKIKILMRKYNQSAVIIQNINTKKDKKILDLLVKTKNTQNQTNLNKKERLLNVSNSIEINKKYKSLKNKIVMIIDDVMTTGATLQSCSEELIKAGVKKIYCITVTRVCAKNI